MKHSDVTALATRALDTWGEDAQLAQACEELAELIVALSHLRRRRVGCVTEVVNELADVLIMVEQIRLILGRLGAVDRFLTGDDEIEHAVQLKLARLEERLDALPKQKTVEELLDLARKR